MPDVAVAATLENVAESDEIRIDVHRRILDRIAHPRLRRHVHDCVEMLIREKRGQSLSVRHIEFLETESFVRAQAGKAPFLEADIIVVAEVIDPDDLIAAFEQPQGKGPADEAGNAGDENFHGD